MGWADFQAFAPRPLRLEITSVDRQATCPLNLI